MWFCKSWRPLIRPKMTVLLHKSTLHHNWSAYMFAGGTYLLLLVSFTNSEQTHLAGPNQTSFHRKTLIRTIPLVSKLPALWPTKYFFFVDLNKPYKRLKISVLKHWTTTKYPLHMWPTNRKIQSVTNLSCTVASVWVPRHTVYASPSRTFFGVYRFLIWAFSASVFLKELWTAFRLWLTSFELLL